MKIALFSSKGYDEEYFNAALENLGTEHSITYFETQLNRDTTSLTPGYDCVCVFVNDKLDEDVISRLADNGIRVIALRCAGFNNVDLEAAQEHEIMVVRVPAYSPEAVAEHALALILTLNRKTHKAYNRVREHNFSLERLTGFDIHGKTIGVVGTGLIGAAFCKIMLGFGCRVLAFDPQKNESLEELGVNYVDFEDLLDESNIISLHCPLNAQTRHLFNRDVFDKMKPGAMLINTSRGGLINTEDAISALKTGKLGYLGIDVYEQEEQLFFRDLSEIIIEDDVIARLMTFHNVLITAHQGFFTREALTEIAETTLKNVTDIETRGSSGNEVKLN